MISPLVTPEDLLTELAGDQPPVLLDVRYRMGGPGGLAEFEKGHLPGAAYVDLDSDLAAPPGEGGRHPLPEPEVFVAAMRRVGVRNDRPVVVYDDWNSHAAPRAWWLLRHHGHGDVRVLDGGWAGWQAAGGAVETGLPEVAPGDFAGEPGSMPVVGPDDLETVAVLIDARAPERFAGEVEPIDLVAGHIPGAVNVPTGRNLDASGRFLPAAQVREVYAETAALDSGAVVAAYCGSGVTACVDLLALEVAGVRGALYPGSWSGWIADRSRPVATGR